MPRDRGPSLFVLPVIAVSQFVAFSADSAYFSSLSVTFNNLFAMSESRHQRRLRWIACTMSSSLRAAFAQQFQIFTLSTPRVITTLYFMLFSLIATMLLNLLIGVVTETVRCRRRTSRNVDKPHMKSPPPPLFL